MLTRFQALSEYVHDFFPSAFHTLTDADTPAQSTSQEYKPVIHTHLMYFLVYTL